MKDKIQAIVTAVLIIALGFVVVFCGGGAALDLYMGIVLTVLGAIAAALAIFVLLKTKALLFTTTFAACALLTLGIALLAEKLSIAVIIYILVFLLLALGVALVLYGVYTILGLKLIVNGVVQIIIGAAIVTLTLLFLFVPEFAKAFWIIVGVIIIVYGILSLVFAITGKELKKN